MKLSHFISQIAFSSLAFGTLLMAGGHAHAAHIDFNSNANQTVRISKAAPQTTRQTQFHSHASTVQYRAAEAAPKQTDANFNRISTIAHSKLGDRYVLGATGAHTFDCSGFTKYVYQYGANKTLPRTAEAQREAAQHVARGQERKGDLAFFGYGSASHVGLYLGHGKMIDAQNRGVVVEHVHAPWWHLMGYGRP